MVEFIYPFFLYSNVKDSSGHPDYIRKHEAYKHMLVIMTINCSPNWTSLIRGADAPKLPAPPPSGDGCSPQQLSEMTRDHDFSALQNFGGVSP